MRLAVAVVLLAACGHSPHSVPDGGAGDAGIDGATDAGVDAPIDAPPCTAPDSDGDGVCDTADLCPGVPDPGQADLDGDHIGWMCDPVESVTLVGDGTIPQVFAAIHENTFAARTKFQYVAYNVTGHALVQVGATGAVITRSDSTAPEDAWQSSTAAPWLEGPVVTPDDHVLWSRGYDAGDTGDFDVATHTFTPRANGVLEPAIGVRSLVVYAGDVLEAVSLQTAPDGLTSDLLDVRAGGMLVPVATAQTFTTFADNGIQAIPGTMSALVPVRRNFKAGLGLYTRGASALADVIVDGAPLTNLDELEPMMVDGSPLGYCVERNMHTYYVGWDAAGVVAGYELPVAGCIGIVATDRGAARIFYLTQGNANVIGYVYAGAFHTLTSGPFAAVTGSTLPVLVQTFAEVWQIAADGSATLVDSGLDDELAAQAGDTINVLEFHRYPNDPNGRGDWIFRRFRSGQPTQSTTLLTNTYNGIGLSMMTSVEGAALISGGPNVIIPSQSMTQVPSSVGEMYGGIRDGRTVVFGRSTVNTGGVYAYSEVNGAPTFTTLDPVGSVPTDAIIDTPMGPTSWFSYGTASGGCKLARFTTGNTLETIPCATNSNVHVLGIRADGTIIVSDGASVFALASTGAQRIGATGASEQPIVDTSVTPPALVGWSAAHGTAMERFSCLASHPDRCWLYPYASVTTEPSTYASAATDSFQHVIQSWHGTAGQVLVTVVRSIGTGNFTP